MIFDVSNINKIFDMMYEKYSKMNKVQLEKRYQKIRNGFKKGVLEKIATIVQHSLSLLNFVYKVIKIT